MPISRKHRQRLFWIAHSVGWGATALNAVNMVRLLEVMGAGIHAPAVAILLGIVRAIIGFVFSASLLRYLLRIARKQFRIPGQFGILIPSAFLVTALDTAFSITVLQILGLSESDPIITNMVAGTILARVFIYMTWGGLYLVITHFFDVQDELRRTESIKQAAQVAELQALRAQINPHFLFNSLNSVVAELRNPAVAEEIALALSNYLRYSLQYEGQWRPFGEELAAIESYLSVESHRFAGRFEYSVSANETTRNFLAPTALLLPLVENAVKYGQQTSPPPLRIEIVANTEDAILHLTVSNTGTWIAPSEDGRDRIGLANLRRRLELLGENVHFEVKPVDNQVVATIAFSPSVDTVNCESISD
ncbi:MAG: histidine kinase [Verrucomicrobiota bacterium]